MSIAPDSDILDFGDSRDTVSLNEPPGVLANADEREGAITGALKRTGSSIVRTSMKTGASFVDMLRVVNRAVRRALPDRAAWLRLRHLHKLICLSRVRRAEARRL